MLDTPRLEIREVTPEDFDNFATLVGDEEVMKFSVKGPLSREEAKEHFENRKFSRKNYIDLFKNISTATASRDLKYCVDKKLVEKFGDKRLTSYRFR